MSRSRIVFFAALMAAALWPAIVSGGGLWFPDLAPYVRGGHVATQTVLGLSNGPPSDVGVAPPVAAVPGDTGVTGGAGLASESADEVSGVRSIPYSVFAYLATLTLPRFWALVLVQAAALAFLVLGFARREAGPAWIYVALVAVSTASLAASTAGPDMWAGLLLLGIASLARSGRAMGRAELWLTGLIVTFGLASHASHILLGAALGLFVWMWPKVTGAKPGGGKLVALAMAAGIAGVLATSVIGFGEASLAPKRYPIVLARAIEDGPALWHLEAHCDDYDYAVCEVFPDGIPDDVGSFLWNEGGLRERATPEQMDRVRAEETLILRRAFMEYPFAQARRAVTNFARQAAMIAEAPPLGRIARYDGDGAATPSGERGWQTVRTIAATGHGIVGIGSVIGLFGLGVGGLILSRWSRSSAQLAAIVVFGLLANAAICGVLSAPDGRYQTRVAWVLPLAVVAIASKALSRPNRSRPEASV